MNVAIIVGIIAVLFALLYDKDKSKYGLIIAMAITTIFTAIRWEWGNDMHTYASAFEAYNQEGIHFWELDKLGNVGVRTERSREILWTLTNILCQPIGFFGMTIVLSILQGLAVFWFINRFVPKGYTFFAVFIYCFNPSILVLGCSMMRQWTAICIILLSMKYLVEGKLVPYIALVVTASLFHTSALILLLLYLLRNLANAKINFSHVVILTFAFIVWVFVIGKRFSGLVSDLVFLDAFEGYSSLLNAQSEMSSVGFGSLLNIIIALMGFYFTSRLNDRGSHYLAAAYLGFVLLLPFSTSIVMAGRLLFYFDAISIAVIPLAMRYSKQNLIKNGIFLWVIVFNVFRYFQFFQSSTWRYYYIDYHTIFESPTWM